MLDELALFAGSGGGLLGSVLLGHRTVCAVEIEPYRREVLMRRQRDGVLPVFPIWDDIRTFDGTPWRGVVHLVTGGFPCQPYSVAGKKRGSDDERNLWPDTIRVIREVRPRYALLENVPGLLRFAYFGEILGSLAESGYDAIWDCFPAAAVGAPHLRDRLFILAHTDSFGCNVGSSGETGNEGTSQLTTSSSSKLGGDSSGRPNSRTERGGKAPLADSEGISRQVRSAERERLGRSPGGGDDVANADQTRQLQPQGSEREQRGWTGDGSEAMADTESEQGDTGDARRGEEAPPQAQLGGLGSSVRGDWWESEPNVGRVADGVAHRVDRLSALGDGQVPSVVVLAWHTLMKRALA